MKMPPTEIENAEERMGARSGKKKMDMDTDQEVSVSYAQGDNSNLEGACTS
jgi:hypothetical protein